MVQPIRIICYCTSSLGLKIELLLHYNLRHFQPCSSQRYLWSWWKPRWSWQIQDRNQVLHWSIWKIRYDSNPLWQCSRLVLHKLCRRCTPWCHCTDHFKEKDPLGNCRRNSIHHCPLLLPIQIHLIQNLYSSFKSILDAAIFPIYAISLISTVYTTIYFALFIQNHFSFRLYFKCPVKYSFRNSIKIQFPANTIKSIHYFLSFIRMRYSKSEIF